MILRLRIKDKHLTSIQSLKAYCVYHSSLNRLGIYRQAPFASSSPVPILPRGPALAIRTPFKLVLMTLHCTLAKTLHLTLTHPLSLASPRTSLSIRPRIKDFHAKPYPKAYP